MPGGRPSDIDKIIAYRDLRDAEGNITGREPITVAERIIQALEIGDYLEMAASAVGLHRDTIYGWLRIAGRIRIVNRGDITNTVLAGLTDHERRCLEFSDSVEQAEARWHQTALTTLERMGRGDIEQRTTTTKTNSDGDVETTIKVEHTLPDVRVLMWRLTRRFPERYANRVEFDLPDPRRLDDDEHVDALVETFETFIASSRPKRRRRKPRTDAPSSN